MKSPDTDRRRLLTGGMGAAVGLAGIAAAQATQAGATCGGMPRERYLQYVNWFNVNDPRYLDFYHPDVVLELGNTTLKSAKAIHEFYNEVKAHIHEKVEVSRYVADATGIAAELPTEFRCYRDWPDGYFRRPLKVGEVFRVITFGLYEVESGRFTRIRTARYKMVNDWQLEG